MTDIHLYFFPVDQFNPVLTFAILFQIKSSHRSLCFEYWHNSNTASILWNSFSFTRHIKLNISE